MLIGTGLPRRATPAMTSTYKCGGPGHHAVGLTLRASSLGARRTGSLSRPFRRAWRRCCPLARAAARSAGHPSASQKMQPCACINSSTCAWSRLTCACKFPSHSVSSDQPRSLYMFCPPAGVPLLGPLARSPQARARGTAETSRVEREGPMPERSEGKALRSQTASCRGMDR